MNACRRCRRSIRGRLFRVIELTSADAVKEIQLAAVTMATKYHFS